MNLSKKNILITGGNSGIGLQLAKLLHARGNQLVITSRSTRHWDELAQLNPQVIRLQCDLSKKEQVLQLVQQLKDKGIGLDILVNCAAIQHTPMLLDKEFSFNDIETEVATNFNAPVWLTYLLLPTLVSRPEAAIVNLSSGLALYPKSTSAVYCATKAALHNLSQSLRYQLINTSVQVSEVILPLVDTPMTAGRGRGKISPVQAAKEIIQGIDKNRDEIYVGKARLLPVMMRNWPGLVRRILREY